jgi:putative ubiquitin-RnfH superfamily antitoxin RatB of RatAB toxin-antitoxin module
MAETPEKVRHIEVVYATPEAQHAVELPLAPGMTAAQAVAQSGLLERCPEIDKDTLVLGIFGRRIAPHQQLRAGDRVEICRPLFADPRQMRRTKLARGRAMGKPPGAGVKKQDRA